MNVSFQTTIRYKGGEYARLDDVPADIRAPLDRALARVWSGGEFLRHLNSRVVLNGREYAHPNDVPSEYHKILEQTLHTLLPIDNAICVAAVREYSYSTRGVAGLCTLLVGAIATAWFLYRLGCFG